MPSENDDVDAAKPPYHLRKRAKVTASQSAATEVDQDEQQLLQDSEYDDLGEAYTPRRTDSSTTATTRKRKRAPRGENTQTTKGSKSKADARPAQVQDTTGSLERMMGLPLDLIYEILRHATPYDLLNLARTSKSFRQLLMSRSTRSIWLDAWRNDKSLPRCPDDMAPPAFTELLYDSWCHRCSTSKGDMLWSWIAGARYCSACIRYFSEKMKFDWNDIEYGFNPEAYPLWKILPQVCYHSFRLEDISEFVQAWKQVPESQREEFLETRRQAMAERGKHEDICITWKVTFDAKKAEEKRLAQLKRVESIIERLKELGWTKLLDDMTAGEQNEFLALPDVRKDRKLTNRIINNMLPRLVTWLEACKEAKERPLRKKAIKQRIEDLDNALLPVPADHEINPSIRDIVLDMPEARIAIDVALDAPVSFDALLAALPAFKTQWRNKIYATLTKRIHSEVGNLDVEPLSLAVGEFFRCRDCPMPDIISLPDLLNHHCPRQTGKFHKYYGFSSKAGRVYEDAANELLSLIPTTATQHYTPCARTVSQVLTKLGYVPNKAYVEEMDASAARVVCSRCSTEQRKTILTWRAAARHVCYMPGFYKATDAEAAAVRAQENAIVQKYETDRRIHCAHCPRDERRVDYTIDDLLQHLTERHGLEQPSEQDGFYDTTLPPICQDPVYLDVAVPVVE